MGMQRTELSRHLRKACTHRNPVLTLIYEYKVSTLDTGTGIRPNSGLQAMTSNLGHTNLELSFLSIVVVL